MRNRSHPGAGVCVVMVLAAANGVETHATSVRPFGADRAVQVDTRYDAPSNTYTLKAVGTNTVAYTVDLDERMVMPNPMHGISVIAGRGQASRAAICLASEFYQASGCLATERLPGMPGPYVLGAVGRIDSLTALFPRAILHL